MSLAIHAVMWWGFKLRDFEPLADGAGRTTEVHLIPVVGLLCPALLAPLKELSEDVDDRHRRCQRMAVSHQLVVLVVRFFLGLAQSDLLFPNWTYRHFFDLR